MAIGRISGAMLFSDLDRQGIDLQFTTDSETLVYMDFVNYRLGVNTDVPTHTLTVIGDANVESDVDGSSQFSIRNVNSGARATSAVMIAADNGSNISNHVNLGISNSNFNYRDFEIFSPNDGYFLVNGGNLKLVTSQHGKNIEFWTGGTATQESNLDLYTTQVGNLTATIIDGVGFRVLEHTISTSNSSGAIQTQGGAGITGNLYVGGQDVIYGDEYFANVTLLLHGEGANLANVITDSSSANLIPTIYGNVITSNANSKFGTTSIRFDGNSRLLYSNGSSNFGITGNLEFTIEWWMKPATASIAAPVSLFGTESNVAAGNVGHIWYLSGNGNLHPTFSWGGNTITNVFSSTEPISATEWTHVIFERRIDTWGWFINGNVVTTNTAANLGPYPTGNTWFIGNSKTVFKDSNIAGFNGFIDEFRYTLGVPRYRGSVYPQTEPFKNTSNNTYIGTGGVVITSNIRATSNSTGALQVIGGVGVKGAIYADEIYEGDYRVLTENTGIITIANTGTVTANAEHGVVELTLSSTAVSPGTYGNATAIPRITIGGDGRIYAVSEEYLLPQPTVIFDGADIIPDIHNFGPGAVGDVTLLLTETGVTEGQYGGGPDGNLVQITVDTRGRITNLSNASITSNAIISGLGYVPVNKAGDTMTGDLTVSGNITANAYYYPSGELLNGGATYTTGESPVQNAWSPRVGDQWYDTNTGINFQYFDTGANVEIGSNVKNWVDVSSSKVQSNVTAIANTFVSRQLDVKVGASRVRQWVLTGQTSDGVETEIFVDNLANNRIPINPNTTVYYTVDVSVRRIGVFMPDSGAFTEKGVASMHNGVVTDEGSMYEIVVHRTNPDLAVDVRGDNINKTINVYVTGSNSMLYKWVAFVQTIEITT